MGLKLHWLLEAENYKLILIGTINSIFLVLSKYLICLIYITILHSLRHLLHNIIALQGCRNRWGGGTGRAMAPQFLEDQLTQFQIGGRLCPSHYYFPPSPGFSDLPTALP